MKSYHYLIAVLLVMPVLFSCGGKNNHTPDNPTPVVDPDPPVTPDPVTPDPVDPDPVTPPAPEIEFRRTVRFDNNIISFNSSKDYIAVYKESLLTKSGDPRKIVSSTYSYSGSDRTYVLQDLGKLEVIDDKQIAFTPDGGDRKVYDAETSLIVENESSVAYLANKSWTIEKSRLYFRGASYDLDGLDLNKVEEIARGQGIEFKFHMNPNMVAKKLVITDALLAAQFNNGECYAAEHTLRSGSKFDLSEFTNELKGSASIEFDKDEADLCFIYITTTLDESEAEVEFVLREIK